MNLLAPYIWHKWCIKPQSQMNGHDSLSLITTRSGSDFAEPSDIKLLTDSVWSVFIREPFEF